MTIINARDALRWALQIEANGRAFYEAVASSVVDTNVRLLFQDLAKQEGRHYRAFERLLERAPVAAALSDPEQRQAESYFRALYTHALYGDGERGLALAATATDELSAVQAAIAFEKDTLLFFFEVREQVEPSQQATLTAIIDEEKEHLRQLGRVLQDQPWVS